VPPTIDLADVESLPMLDLDKEKEKADVSTQSGFFTHLNNLQKITILASSRLERAMPLPTIITKKRADKTSQSGFIFHW
jgi:hypothetical protein